MKLPRREILLMPWLAGALARAQEQSPTARGRLGGEGKLKLTDGRLVTLSGDAETTAVLRDGRLGQDEFELRGRFTAPDAFAIDPIHTRSIFVWRGERKLAVTYWCDVCAIRAWTPGKCQCCQDDMALDLRDPKLKDTDL